MEQLLRGMRTMVVEDEYFLADDIVRTLRTVGAEVLGPFNTVEDAMGMIERGEEPVELAILDINLNGQMSFPVADTLKARGIGYVFATGYGHDTIPLEHRTAPRWEKPFDPNALIKALAELRK